MDDKAKRSESQYRSELKRAVRELNRTIAFHRCFVGIRFESTEGKKVVSGELGVHAAAMLSQAMYWSERTKDPEGWFYKSAAEWEYEVGLTRREQDTARRRLRGTQFWKEKLAGRPPIRRFRIDAAELVAALKANLAENAKSNLAESAKLNLAKSAKSISTKAPNQFGEKRQNINKKAETTAEITTETTKQQQSSEKDEQLPAAAAFNEPHLSRFSRAEVEAFVMAMKKNHARNPGGLAWYFWQNGVEDEAIERWKTSQETRKERQEKPNEAGAGVEIATDFSMDAWIDELIAKNWVSQLEHEREGVEERGGPQFPWEDRIIAYFNNRVCEAAA
jgi:hypothetical protein